METSTIKNVLITTFLLGGVYLVYVNRNLLLKLLISSKRRTISKSASKTDTAMTDVCNTFLMYAGNFEGLFEPMYKGSIGVLSLERTKNLLMEWKIRMDNIPQCPISLKSWWITITLNMDSLSLFELQKRLQSIRLMVEECGIIRDDRTVLNVDSSTGIYYQLFDGTGSRLKEGQMLRIESPCWYLPSSPVRIIEKGYCEIM